MRQQIMVGLAVLLVGAAGEPHLRHLRFRENDLGNGWVVHDEGLTELRRQRLGLETWRRSHDR